MENNINNKFAGFWIRHIAMTVDALILLISWKLILLIFSLFGFQLNSGNSISFTSLIFYLILILYFVFFHAHFGKTPGKMLVGVKVVDKNFGKISHLQSFGRFLGTILSLIPFGLGYTWAGWDSKKRTFHDMLAKTLVIEDNPIGKNWVIFWNIFIFILFFFMVFLIIYLIGFLISNPEFLMELNNKINQ